MRGRTWGRGRREREMEGRVESADLLELYPLLRGALGGEVDAAAAGHRIQRPAQEQISPSVYMLVC